jgi:hypothetical protein
MFNTKLQVKKPGALAAYPRSSLFAMVPTKVQEWLQKSSISLKKKATLGVDVNRHKTLPFVMEVIAKSNRFILG